MINIIKFELIKNIVFMAILSSVFVTGIVQIIKENFKVDNSKIYIVISFGISIVFGTLFTFTFSYFNFVYCLWSGLFSFLLSDFLYKTFEDKVFKSCKNISCRREEEE